MEGDPKKQPKRPIVIVGTFMLLTWAAVAANYFSRPAIPTAQILLFGTNGPQQFQAIVQLRHWEDYRNFKGFLITRTIYADRDRMTDDWIAKSVPYTIDGQTLHMVAITNNQMRFSPGKTNFVEYNFVVIPSERRADQIRTLGDVPQLGGQILAVVEQGIPVDPNPTQ
jgi:hypothetical protein